MRGDVSSEDIRRSMEKAHDLLQELGVSQNEITPEELIEYFSGDTPTGDTTTLRMVIENPWLLLHELVELKQLKMMGFTISRRLLWKHPKELFAAHVTATECELEAAFEAGDLEWVDTRTQLIPMWLENSDISPDMRERCLVLMKKYASVLKR
jgi:hypothetical protein